MRIRALLRIFHLAHPWTDNCSYFHYSYLARIRTQLPATFLDKFGKRWCKFHLSIKVDGRSGPRNFSNELAFRANTRAVSVKQDRNRHHERCYTTYECVCPLHTHALIYVRCKHWKHSSSDGARNRIGGNGRRSTRMSRH